VESAGMEGGGRGLGGVPRGGAHPITQSGPTESETLIPPRPLVLSLSWPREQGGQFNGYRVPANGIFCALCFFWGGASDRHLPMLCVSLGHVRVPGIGWRAPKCLPTCNVVNAAGVAKRMAVAARHRRPVWHKGDHDAMGLRAGMVPDAQGYLGIMTGRRPTEHGRRVWTSWRGRDRRR